MFGGDVVVLAQILANALQQLAQLKSIVDNGKDNIELIRDINRGINDSLNLIRTVSPETDPGLYKDWERVSEAVTRVQNIYGIAVQSKDQSVQKDADQSVAEAIAMNNSIYRYTKEIDEIGELIKAESHAVSPGGAAKLTAQSMGVMLNVQNQMLRTQATGLKLQAQAMALQNRKDKEQTRQTLQNGTALRTALRSQSTKFELPRF
ncbi:MAG: hypothetical protein EOP06_20770 [Proteobacteria bacterium]|nr:MAG: hypothetical protein EOP06_20770 [Pseudomonadota bacterium]